MFKASIVPALQPNNPTLSSVGLFIIIFESVNVYPSNVPLNGVLDEPIGKNPFSVVSSTLIPSIIPLPFISPYVVSFIFI